MTNDDDNADEDDDHNADDDACIGEVVTGKSAEDAGCVWYWPIGSSIMLIPGIKIIFTMVAVMKMVIMLMMMMVMVTENI